MHTLRNFLMIAAYLWLAILVSCKHPALSAQEVFLSKISKKWVPASGVKFNDVFVNGVFDNFTINFEKGMTYATTDGQTPVWKPSGKFTLKEVKSAIGFSIIRDDQVEVTVSELTETKLVLKFNFISGGRVRSVSGGYVFDLMTK
jgi:hypothetical protein